MIEIRGGVSCIILFSLLYSPYILEEARRRRRRANCVYNLRQFNSKSEVKIKPCNVKIARLPPELVDCQDLPDPVRPLAGEKGSSVSWISPGSPDVPSDDSIDELIRSSSDSGNYSVVGGCGAGDCW